LNAPTSIAGKISLAFIKNLTSYHPKPSVVLLKTKLDLQEDLSWFDNQDAE
jgi:hypothetical protein